MSQKISIQIKSYQSIDTVNYSYNKIIITNHSNKPYNFIDSSYLLSASMYINEKGVTSINKLL